MGERREVWSGRTGFILSTVGSAIGLGSIWKFPYEVGRNGGGAFVFCYLFGLVLVVFPLMLVEFGIGRRGQADAVGSIELVARQSGVSTGWRWLGALGILTSFLILSFYSVIGGWALRYAVVTVWHGLPGSSAAEVQTEYASFLASPWTVTACHTVFMGMTTAVVGRGITAGIESACKLLMPILIGLIIVLALYAAIEGDVRAALTFLFHIDPSAISARVFLEALGLGFFSIGVGFGVMVTYASYAGPEVDLREVAVATLIGDTVVSCLAGLAVFPIVFMEKLDPASGPGLVFVTLPLAFARLPLGSAAAAAFFVLLTIAGLASAMSLLEMPVAFLQRRFGYGRWRAAIISAAACWALGILSALSFNVLANWFPLASISVYANATVFDLLDQLTSNTMLPAAGCGLAIFGGWLIPRSLLVDELHLGATAGAVRILLRYVVPSGIIAASIANFVPR